MTTEARCFAVLGDPVRHSLSPRMHNAAFAALDLPHRYFAFRVRPADLAAALGGARAMGLGGLNLTVPHKQAALAVLDALGPEAGRIGAVNTVCFQQGRAVGHNTDGIGFVRGLQDLCADPPSRIVVLGSGGASRAVIDALGRHHPRAELRWVTRDPSRLSAPGASVESYDALATGTEPIDLLVNTTTVGMAGGPTQFPTALPLQRLQRGACVVDLVYPRPDGGLLDQAEASGCRVQDGRTMLLWQGAEALELWLGGPLPAKAVDAMRRALQL